MNFDAAERVAFGLGLDDADRFAVGVKEIVGLITSKEREFANRNPEFDGEVRLHAVLHGPAACGELAVNVLSSFRFGISAHVFRISKLVRLCKALPTRSKAQDFSGFGHRG